MADPNTPEYEAGIGDDAQADPQPLEQKNTEDVFGEGAEAQSPESQVDSLQAELAQSNDRLLRIQAELENYRKRARREMADQMRYAQLPLIRDLLSVLDNLERAIQAAEQTEKSASLLEGVKLVVTQLSAVLKNHDCQPMEAEGTSFDPNMHEAISQQPSEEHSPGTVLHMTQTGYHLHDRVVRPAQVVVSTGHAKEPMAPTAELEES